MGDNPRHLRRHRDKPKGLVIRDLAILGRDIRRRPGPRGRDMPRRRATAKTTATVSDARG